MGYSSRVALEIYQEILNIHKFLACNGLTQTQDSIVHCNKSHVQQMP